MTEFVRLLAALLFLALLLWLFRFAMALRYAKVLREQERRRHRDRGRRLVAEVPTPAGDVVLFLEGAAAFHWGDRELPKAGLLGARLILNGHVVEERARAGVALPPVGWSEDADGRERWDVRFETTEGPVTVPCGTLREGVSRETARQVFAAAARALEP